jgi:serine/threonine protein phosphatase PrpC
VRAASVVGADHRCEEPATARQDAYRLGRDRKGRYLLIAVADGMSAAKRSDLGATVAVRTAIDGLRGALDHGAQPGEIDFLELFKSVSQNIVGAAKHARRPPDDLLTALIVAVVPVGPAANDGARTVWLASVADVGAWLHRGDVWSHVAGELKDGLDRNALATFLPHYWSAVEVVQAELAAGSALAVVTDGVGDAFSDIPQGALWFAERWHRPPPLASFILDVDYEAAGQVDDRTAVVVWTPRVPR